MQKVLKIYIIAGEPSGDYLGSTTIKAILKQNPNVKFYGVGGALMQNITSNNAPVFKSLFNIKQIAIMGFVEVISKIFKINKLINATVKDILQVKPDVILTIDSLGFNKRVIAKVKPFTNAKLIHLVAPTVWAWKPKRVFEIAHLYHQLLCLFKFEIPYFKNYVQTSFVGHPIVESIEHKAQTNNSLYSTFNLPANNVNVLLMPGSRKTETTKLLPIFIQVAKLLNAQYSNINFILPTVDHLYNHVSDYIKQSNVKNITVITQQHKYNAFNVAKFALVASGTATLELALYNVNCVVAYKVNWLSGFIAKFLIKVKYASIINIMANKQIIPEFIQQNCTVDNLFNVCNNFMQKNNTLHSNPEVISILNEIGFNTFTPSFKVANKILNINNKG